MKLPWHRDLDFDKARAKMVRRDLAGRDIKDPRVLDAFARVGREKFVWDSDLADAYADHPLRIGESQTISQPYMVALMTQELELEGGERVLEIGTGSGYQTAILAELAREVYTIDRFRALSEKAQEELSESGCGNIHYRVGDGTLGWPEEAPFDRIIVTAGAPSVPESLKAQLSRRGRLVIPVGGKQSQDLLIVTRQEGEFPTRSTTGCIFVRLVGAEGWPEE